MHHPDVVVITLTNDTRTSALATCFSLSYQSTRNAYQLTYRPLSVTLLMVSLRRLA